ncbi:MAG TPA: hemolysin family protein, partial [Gemmatimonadales bacterium]|nr:hemolysin family protein [Gemmatimonadales bacterium]
GRRRRRRGGAVNALLLVVGFVLTIGGATAAASLVAEGRRELARAADRRLRGGRPPARWLSEAELFLGSAQAATALGVVLLGCAFPAVVTGFAGAAFAAVLVFAGVPLLLLVGYLAPRWVARVSGGGGASVALPAITPFARILGPLLPAAHHGGDPTALVREALAAGMAVDRELALAGGVMTFAERPVREVMTPRTDVVAVPEDASRHDLLRVFGQSGFSRVPVYRGSLDEIVGVFHAFDLFTHGEDALTLRAVTHTPGTRSCGDLLLAMQRERRHLAVVLDEFGGTAGIVTLEDLLTALVGEIFDEDDPGAAAPGVEALFEADGATPLDALAVRFGIALPETRATTVAGLLAELAGRIPQAGERLLFRGLEFDILQASPARVERALVRAAPVPTLTLDARSA